MTKTALPTLEMTKSAPGSKVILRAEAISSEVPWLPAAVQRIATKILYRLQFLPTFAFTISYVSCN